ncbi:hypothetical protein B0H34DRAFT_60760 [Crassisporium funariophilum]|nr:hypothetical protein B0H34DRAFT_60760 [Crassisporium funariophilum]
MSATGVKPSGSLRANGHKWIWRSLIIVHLSHPLSLPLSLFLSFSTSHPIYPSIMGSTNSSSPVTRAGPPATLTTSERFCDPNADLILTSSDGVRFHVYRKYLEACTGGFPPAEIPVSGEVVELSEPAKVLEILLQFIHPQRQPSVMDMDIDLFFSLAEAAEKYEVYGAMNTCNTRIHQIVDLRPMDILNYAVKHGYSDLANMIAPKTVLDRRCLDQAIEKLSHPGALIAWLRYYSAWDKITELAIYQLSKEPHQGACWTKLNDTFIKKLASSPRLDWIPLEYQPGCRQCYSFVESVNPRLEKMYQDLPKFSHLIKI